MYFSLQSRQPIECHNFIPVNSRSKFGVHQHIVSFWKSHLNFIFIIDFYLLPKLILIFKLDSLHCSLFSLFYYSTNSPDLIIRLNNQANNDSNNSSSHICNVLSVNSTLSTIGCIPLLDHICPEKVFNGKLLCLLMK